MDTRINYAQAAPEVLQAMLALSGRLEKSGIEPGLVQLVELRASQINHCAFCIDMHSKDLRASGASEQKIYMLDAWREWSGYSTRERAALEWTEAVTQLTDGFVPDSVYEIARAEFDERELVWLTLAVVTINGWNRLNVALRTPAGSYESPLAARTKSHAG